MVIRSPMEVTTLEPVVEYEMIDPTQVVIDEWCAAIDTYVEPWCSDNNYDPNAAEVELLHLLLRCPASVY